MAVVLRNIGERTAKMNWGQDVYSVFPGGEVELQDVRCALWMIERFPADLRVVKADEMTPELAQYAIPAPTPDVGPAPESVAAKRPGRKQRAAAASSAS